MKRTTRRKFLKETLLGAGFLSTARFLTACGTGTTPASIAGRLKFFSVDEYDIMRHVADRIVGAAGADGIAAHDIDAALRADAFLAGADPEVQEQFHQLLTVFNAPLFTFLFDFRFSSFVAMRPGDQDTYLEDWMTSSLSFRRTAFQALKRTCMSMFYTDSRSWPEIGYEGMFLPEDRL